MIEDPKRWKSICLFILAIMCFVPCLYYVVIITSGVHHMYFRMSKPSSGPQASSTPMSTSRVEEFYVNLEDEIKESNELNEGEDVNLETSEPTPITTSKEAEVEIPSQDFKRPRR